MTRATSITAPSHPPRAPRVPGHPILGCLPEFRRDALAYYRGCHARFGDVFEVRFVTQPVVTIAHPDGIQRVLQLNHLNYQRAPFINDLFIRLTGLNLFTLDGPSWLAERRLLQPAFHRARIQAFGQTMVTAAERLLDAWRAAARSAGGEAHMDMQAEMRRVTMAVVGRSLFSVDFSGDAAELGRAMLAMLLPHVDATPVGTGAVEPDTGFTLQVAGGLAMGVRVLDG